MRKIAFAAIFFVFNGAYGENLWGDVNTGSSLHEIKKIYKNGVELEIDEKYNIRSGANLRYRINEVEVLGRNYEASFYFQKEALEQVTLSFKKKISDSECDSIYGNLIDALSGKYGISVNENGKVPSRRLAQSTFSTDSKIVSTFAQAVNDKCSIYVFYKDKQSGSSANL